MMVLRLNTLMVLAVAADECMCQLFPVRGGDGQLKFAANDDGSKDNFIFSYTRHYIASSRVEFVGGLTHELPTLLLACSLNGR